MPVVIMVVCVVVWVEACNVCGSVCAGAVLGCNGWCCGMGIVYPLNDGE